MSKHTKVRVTNAQTDALCIFFEENPEVIRGYKKTPKHVEAVQNKWKKVTPHLNALGPARNYKAWAKYLSDLKAKLKRKRIKWKQNSDGTGPIICNAEDFTEIKLRMLQVLRKDALNTQDSNNSNTSDLETEGSPTYEDDHNDSYGMVVFPLKESKDETKQNSAYTKCIPNETQSPEPLTTHVFMNHNEFGDEFDTFGKNVAQQLRTLPLPVALETQEMLLSVIRKQRLKVLTESNNHCDPLDK